MEAHAGELYNEIVDAYAKKATTKDQVDTTIKYSERQIKTLIKENIKNKWQERWENNRTGRHTTNTSQKYC